MWISSTLRRFFDWLLGRPQWYVSIMEELRAVSARLDTIAIRQESLYFLLLQVYRQTAGEQPPQLVFLPGRMPPMGPLTPLQPLTSQK